MTQKTNGVSTIAPTTSRISVIKSTPDRPVTRVESSSKGLQIWSVSPPGIEHVPHVIGLSWDEVEKALVQAIEDGHYKPERLLYGSPTNKSE